MSKNLFCASVMLAGLVVGALVPTTQAQLPKAQSIKAKAAEEQAIMVKKLLAMTGKKSAPVEIRPGGSVARLKLDLDPSQIGFDAKIAPEEAAREVLRGFKPLLRLSQHDDDLYLFERSGGDPFATLIFKQFDNGLPVFGA